TKLAETQSCASTILEIDDLGHLVVLGIDDQDAVSGIQELVSLDLRHLAADLGRHRLQLGILWNRLSHLRTSRRGRRLELHVLDPLLDDVPLLEREVQARRHDPALSPELTSHQDFFCNGFWHNKLALRCDAKRQQQRGEDHHEPGHWGSLAWFCCPRGWKRF